MLSRQEETNKPQSRPATTKQKLMESFGLDLNRNDFSKGKEGEPCSSPLQEETHSPCEEETRAPQQPEAKCLTEICSGDQDWTAEAHNCSTGDIVHPSNTKKVLRL